MPSGFWPSIGKILRVRSCACSTNFATKPHHPFEREQKECVSVEENSNNQIIVRVRNRFSACADSPSVCRGCAGGRQRPRLHPRTFSVMMAPLQSKDLKFGANYMPAPMSAMADVDRKSVIMPSAPSAEVDMSAAGGMSMNGGHGTMSMMATAGQRPSAHKRLGRRSSAVCAVFSVILVIFCCVITGLEVSREATATIEHFGVDGALCSRCADSSSTSRPVIVCRVRLDSNLLIWRLCC